MEIKLTPQDSEKLFHTALCNGLGQISGYDMKLKYKRAEYDAAKEKLDQSNIICFEDVLLQILRDGGQLKMEDLAGDMDSIISLEQVHERVSKAPADSITAMINEQDDAITADDILQTVFWEEVIFG